MSTYTPELTKMKTPKDIAASLFTSYASRIADQKGLPTVESVTECERIIVEMSLDIESELSTAKAEGYREAIEAVAAICKSEAEGYTHNVDLWAADGDEVNADRDRGFRDVCNELSEAIRALLPVNSTNVTDAGDTDG